MKPMGRQALVLENYDAVAAEYYDSDRHPTCANFRAASKALLRQFIDDTAVGGDSWIEVGTGNSVLAEIFVEKGRSVSNILLTDASPQMLSYSAQWQELGAKLLIAAADNLPLESDSVDVVVSSLGDPYNTPAFWAETYRILRTDGHIFFTTPAYEWASSYRSAHQYPSRESEFLLVSGVEVALPSIILSKERQLALLRAEGLQVVANLNFDVGQFEGQVSPKLLREGEARGTVVVGYHAVKRSVR
jgi:ubiquinone/menaquinone biosynthesis C-methylase UbiE